MSRESILAERNENKAVQQSQLKRAPNTHYLILALALVIIAGTGCVNIHEKRPVSGEFIVKELQSFRIEDISALYGQQINYLRLDDNPFLENLAPLKGMPLRTLSLSGTAVKDLSPLKDMHLTSLFLGDTPVKDLLPLKGMPLELIDISNTYVEDIEPLQGMMIVSLSMEGCNLKKGLDVLEDMPLKVLEMNAAGVTNWGFLYSADIEILSLKNGTAPDLTKLRNKRWRGLVLEDLGIEDISPLVGMNFFATAPFGIDLSIANNQIKDIRPLLNLVMKAKTPSSEFDLWIDISGNPIDDYTPLNELPSTVFVIIDKTQYSKAKVHLTNNSQVRVQDREEFAKMKSGAHVGKDISWFRSLQQKQSVQPPNSMSE